MSPSSRLSARSSSRSSNSHLLFAKSTFLFLFLFLFFGRILASQAAVAAALHPTTQASRTPALPHPHLAADADHSVKQPPPPPPQPQRNPQADQLDRAEKKEPVAAAIVMQHPQAEDKAQAHLHQSPQREDDRQQQQQQQPPAYTPVVTPAPEDKAALLSKGLRQTTFYACRTAAGGREHCGWHVPVVQVAATARKTTETGIVVAVVVCVAGVFVAGMM